MRKQIEQIMNKVESGDLAYHDAVNELLLLYNVVSQVCEHKYTWTGYLDATICNDCRKVLDSD
jgi:hypothetical protein